MTAILLLASVVVLSALSPFLGVDTRRPETMRTRGGTILR